MHTTLGPLDSMTLSVSTSFAGCGWCYQEPAKTLVLWVMLGLVKLVWARIKCPRTDDSQYLGLSSEFFYIAFWSNIPLLLPPHPQYPPNTLSLFHVFLFLFSHPLNLTGTISEHGWGWIQIRIKTDIKISFTLYILIFGSTIQGIYNIYLKDVIPQCWSDENLIVLMRPNINKV